MYLFFTFFTFLLAIAGILGIFFIIITTPNYEWPVVILITVITMPVIARKVYQLILENLDLDFLYAGHDITPHEVQPWRKVAIRLWVGMILFGLLGIAAWIGFILLGGPSIQEAVYRAGRKVEIMKDIWKIVASYSCYLTALLFTSLIFGYCAVLLRGWYFSSHANSRFIHTIQAIRNFFLSFFGKVTGIEIKHEEEPK